MRQVSVGGAPASAALLGELEAALGCECICGYGMTESSPTLTRSLPKPGRPSTPTQRATTGIPILGVDVRVLGPGDVEVPWDGSTVGEICARSNHVMIGYLRAPEATDAVLRGGWLRTGDLAVVDPDGYLTIVDRAKDLIVSGGENIASVEVEHAIEIAPRRAGGRRGRRPRRALGRGAPRVRLTRARRRRSTEAELIAWVRERLAPFKTPKSVVFLDDLPKGGTGKIQKQALRALVLTVRAEPAGRRRYAEGWTGRRGRGRARRRSW